MSAFHKKSWFMLLQWNWIDRRSWYFIATVFQVFPNSIWWYWSTWNGYSLNYSQNMFAYPLIVDMCWILRLFHASLYVFAFIMSDFGPVRGITAVAGFSGIRRISLVISVKVDKFLKQYYTMCDNCVVRTWWCRGRTPVRRIISTGQIESSIGRTSPTSSAEISGSASWYWKMPKDRRTSLLSAKCLAAKVERFLLELKGHPQATTTLLIHCHHLHQLHHSSYLTSGGKRDFLQLK